MSQDSSSFIVKQDVFDCPPKKRKQAAVVYLIGASIVHVVAFFQIVTNIFYFGFDRFLQSRASMSLLMADDGVITYILLAVSMFASVAYYAGLIVAVIISMQPEKQTQVEFDSRSGSGSSAQIPVEIKQWNWSAAFLPVVWGIYHRVYWSLLALIPLVGGVWWVFMGIKGNEWAWGAIKWKSVDDFQMMQTRWKPWGIAAAIITALQFIITVGSLVFLFLGILAFSQ